MKKGMTIKQIAEAAGVSIGTVSRIINHQNFGYSQETYKRVQEIIGETGYMPNRVARSMITKRSFTIGYLVDDISNPFFPEIAKGINSVASEKGFNLLLCEGGGNAKTAEQHLKTLYKSGVDGIITGSYILSEENIDYLLKIQLPFVILDANMTDSGFYNISVDNYSGARTIMDYLISKGHRKIACITGPMEMESSRKRLNGYKAVMAENGLDWDGMIVEGDFTQKGGILAAKEMEGRDYTAVFAFNDMMAIGVCNYLHENGFRVPEDVSVVGFDDISMAAYMFPPLTTMHQPLFEMGQGAMEMLLSAMEDKTSGEYKERRFDLTLVERKSVAAPRMKV